MEDLKTYLPSLCGFLKKELQLPKLPKLNLIKSDKENGDKFFGKTAYYNPNDKSITLYTYNRHAKDCGRSFSHEMIHYKQDLEGRLNNISTTNINEDDYLKEIEREAYEKGNMLFRSWENNYKKDLKENKMGNLLNLAHEYVALHGDVTPEELAKGLKIDLKTAKKLVDDLENDFKNYYGNEENLDENKNKMTTKELRKLVREAIYNELEVKNEDPSTLKPAIVFDNNKKQHFISLVDKNGKVNSLGPLISEADIKKVNAGDTNDFCKKQTNYMLI